MERSGSGVCQLRVVVVSRLCCLTLQCGAAEGEDGVPTTFNQFCHLDLELHDMPSTVAVYSVSAMGCPFCQTRRPPRIRVGTLGLCVTLQSGRAALSFLIADIVTLPQLPRSIVFSPRQPSPIAATPSSVTSAQLLRSTISSFGQPLPSRATALSVTLQP